MRLICAVLLLVLVPRDAAAQDSVRAQSLRNAGGVILDYGSWGTSLPTMDTTTLRTTLEVELRKARIPFVVYSPGLDRAELLAKPMLSLSLTVVSGGSLAYAYSTLLEIRQFTVLTRNGALANGATWNARPQLGWATQSLIHDQIVSAIRQQLDEFVNAYLSVNK
jgi:hypothetical protein